jgi:lysozyme
MRAISAEGVELIKGHEGRRLTAYLDPVDIWTIGYGHTGQDVIPGMTITDEDAEHMLLNDLADTYDCIESFVDVELTDCQYAALCSFIFNLGCGAFKNSTLLRLLNTGDYDGARKQFPRWVHAGGKKLAGLVKRRSDEARLFAA